MNDKSITELPTRPTKDETKDWPAYWQAHGASWRTEPEIDEERQIILAKYRAITPDIAQGIYPFTSIEPNLTRADIEWLLATHTCSAHEGPIDSTNPHQARLLGLDLRGARLSHVSLSKLPLTNIIGGLQTSLLATLDPALQMNAMNAAAIHLDGSDLNGTHFERAELAGAHLEEAKCVGTHFEGAYLFQVKLQRACLIRATFYGAVLIEADLRRITARYAHFEGAVLSGARLTHAELSATNFDAANLQTSRLDHVRLRGATLAGANLSQAHLEGAELTGANLGGRLITQEEADALEQWARKNMPIEKNQLYGANLQNSFFSSTTNLSNTHLGTKKMGCVSLANIHYDGINLGTVDWSDVEMLGDEREALESNKKENYTQAGIQIFHLQTAARAYRQLSLALSSQGLTVEANRYGYRAQVLARQVLWRKLCLSGHGLPKISPKQKMHMILSYMFSLLLDALAGYGYNPGRNACCYVIVIFLFMFIYHTIGMVTRPHLSFLSSFVFSVTSFHGRGFFPGGISLDNPTTVMAAIEAIVGLIIELSFITTFTQRYFGK